MAPDIDRNVVELLVHRRVNRERRNHGLESLSYDRDLVAIARDHSEDMAEREFVAHVNPDGDGPTDRYATAGYDCRVPAEDGRYLQGAENVAKTHVGVPLEDGSRNESADDVVSWVVDGWMDSPGHRENVLTEHWRCEGIGVAVVEDEPATTVYVTQNFC